MWHIRAGVRLPWPVDGRSAVRGEPRTETSKHFVAVREHGNPKQFTIAGPPTWPPSSRAAGCRPTRRCVRSSGPCPGGDWTVSAPGPTWWAGTSATSK